MAVPIDKDFKVKNDTELLLVLRGDQIQEVLRLLDGCGDVATAAARMVHILLVDLGDHLQLHRL